MLQELALALRLQALDRKIANLETEVATLPKHISEIENAVFRLADFGFYIGDLMLESLVLLVRLHRAHLIAELRDLLLVKLNVALELLSIALIGR